MDNDEAHRTYGEKSSFHHNLYVYNLNRQPKIVTQTGPFDFRNNVIEDWRSQGTEIEEANSVNIINNYYGSSAQGDDNLDGFCIDANSVNIYTAGNYNVYEDVDSQGDRGTPVEEPSVTTMAAGTALVNDVRGDCGAMPRDSFDEGYAGPAN